MHNFNIFSCRTKRHTSTNNTTNEEVKVKGRRSHDALGRTTKSKSHAAPSGRRVSWSTVNTLESVTNILIDSIGVKDIKSKTFKHLLQPLRFTDELVYNALFTFCGSIVDYVPRVQHDRRYYDLICVVLSSKVCVRLYGLLAHFCFWNIIHPCARSALCAVYEREGFNTAILSTLVGESDSDDNSRTNVDDHDNFDKANEAEEGSLRENIFAGIANESDPLNEEQPSDKLNLLDDPLNAGRSYSASVGINNSQLFNENSLLSLSSDCSLSPAEKEILFIQIEQCLAKVHRYVSIHSVCICFFFIRIDIANYWV